MNKSFKYIPQKDRKKILLICDDIRVHSGVATVAKEIVMKTAHHFNWAQIAGAISHPEAGKRVDLSQDTNKISGIKDSYVVQYPASGYGTPQLVRQLITLEKPDAIMLITDPRYFRHIWDMENEIRTKIPITYLNIWDDYPAPAYNKPYYEACDLLMGISKQTYNIVHNVIRKYPKKDWQIKYVPHGINENHFFPIENKLKDETFLNYKKEILKKDYEFVAFYNNRNIRRKNPGDLILAYKTFCDMLPKEKAKKCCLLLHATAVDPNGTDLPAVINEICPDYKVIIDESKVDDKHMNWLYNIGDVTVNIASNEGFGLSGAESLMSGTPIINNITGGLQDHCGFKLNGKYLTADDYVEIGSLHDDRKWKNEPKLTHGEWVKPVWPSNRALVGSPPTPYIFDDRCRFDDVAEAMKSWYDEGHENREDAGAKGREFVLDPEVGMSCKQMGLNFIKDMDGCFEKFEKRKRFTLFEV